MMLIQYMLCYALHHNLWTQFRLSCRISLQEHPPLPLSGQPLRDPSSTYAVEAGPTSSHINGQRVSYTLPPPPLHTPPPSSHPLLTPPPHTPSSHPLLTPPPHTPSSRPLLTPPPHTFSGLCSASPSDFAQGFCQADFSGTMFESHFDPVFWCRGDRWTLEQKSLLLTLQLESLLYMPPPQMLPRFLRR